MAAPEAIRERVLAEKAGSPDQVGILLAGRELGVSLTRIDDTCTRQSLDLQASAAPSG